MRAESPKVEAFRHWFSRYGGELHKHVLIIEETWGVSVVAKEDIAANTIIVSCPFSLIITQALAQRVLSNFIDVQSINSSESWRERQWISTYLCFHWIIEQNTKESENLLHYEYVHILPSLDKLRTPHYFTVPELEAFKGTNLYGATLDREREWRAEHARCLAAVSRANAGWAALFTWERYLAGVTYLTSRAYPSSILASEPTLIQDPSTVPILIPGLDSLNHARGAAVTWAVTYPVPNHPVLSGQSRREPLISVVLHDPVKPHQEIFNNYGPKPNSELILGYGFSFCNNPDDSIILKIGGINGQRWSIGRGAYGVEGLWAEIVQTISTEGGYEDQLDAAGLLQEMCENLLDKLPRAGAGGNYDMRPEVALMLQHYVKGQSDILESVIEYAREKEEEAMMAAGEDRT